MPDPLLEAIQDVITVHTFTEAVDGDYVCSCDKWGPYPYDRESDARIEFAEHVASAVYTATLASGRLLPETEDCVEMYGAFRHRPAPPPWKGQDGTWMYRSSLHAAFRTASFLGPDAYAAKCLSIVYPDGTETRTPWVELPMPEIYRARLQPVDTVDDTPSFP